MLRGRHPFPSREWGENLALRCLVESWSPRAVTLNLDDSLRLVPACGTTWTSLLEVYALQVPVAPGRRNLNPYATMAFGLAISFSVVGAKVGVVSALRSWA